MQMKNINISQLGTTVEIEKLTLTELLNLSSQTFANLGDLNNSASNTESINNVIYKPVPPPKPLSSPPYRMPPQPPGSTTTALYSDAPIPGSTNCGGYEVQQGSPLHHLNGHGVPLRTHSSKFPIERELILTGDKGSSKIPLMHDSGRTIASATTTPSGIRRNSGLQLLPRPPGIAPEHPPPRLHAWNAQSNHNNSNNNNNEHNNLASSQLQQQQSLTGAIPRTPARLPEDVTALAERDNNSKHAEKDSKNAVTKTYHTLKDLISSKFKKDTLEGMDELNNVTSVVQQQQHQPQIVPYQQQPNLDDFRSPYSALPTHMRHQGNQNQSQPNVWQANQMSSPTPQQQQQQHLNPQRNYAPPDPPRGVNAQQRAASQPQLNLHFERRGSQNLLDKVAERRGSLANIDVTDSDEGGFATKPNRPQTMYQIPGQQQQQNPSPQNVHQRNSPQVFQQPSSYQSAYASTLQQQHSYQQMQYQQQQQQQYLIQSTSQQQDSILIQSRQDVGRSSMQRQELPANTSDLHNQRPELPLKQSQKQQQEQQQHRLTPAQELNKPMPGSAASSDYDKSGNQSSNVDSGRGSAAYSSGRKGGGTGVNLDTSPENSDSPIRVKDNDSEWVDIVDAELRNILEPGIQSLTLRPESTISGSVSSMSPPLPPLSPGGSTRYKSAHGKDNAKQEYGMDSYNRPNRSTGPIGPSRAGWPGSTVQKQGRPSSSKKQEQTLLKRHLFGLDNDIASTTTRSLDLESLLGTPWGAGQSVSDSETDTQGLRHIRSQLEGLEHMYGEVLRMLGSRLPHGQNRNPHETPLRSTAARRRHGSLSSLPSSSVSGRPIRDRRRTDERRKVRDIKGINKRFQRLESHVVTLARSVAHLSSEMRSQHMVTQELERMRDDLATLRAQAGRIQHLYRAVPNNRSGSDPEPLNLTNPKRVKKLTKFFGEDPPLMRLFLKKLGYEKYANLFETERVGMIELPYLGEERLQKLGVPLGPRLRILQEAQISLCKDTTLCIV